MNAPVSEQETIVLRGREVGAAGYITKPFSTDEVVERVRAILGD